MPNLAAFREARSLHDPPIASRVSHDHNRTPLAVHERAHMTTAQVRPTVAQRHLVRLHAGTFSAIGGNSLDRSFKSQSSLGRSLLRQRVVRRIQVRPNTATTEPFRDGQHRPAATEWIEHQITEATPGQDARLD